MRARTSFAVTAAFAALGLGLANPAGAVQQDGLVNLVLTDTTVQVPVALAANICDVDVNVLAQALASGPADCNAGADSTAERAPGGQDGSTRQRGLVNVFVDDTTVQVPIAVAANICDVAVTC